MILAITDAKKLTFRVEDTRDSGGNVSEIYKDLFEKHIRFLAGSHVSWKVIKTTGDGLLITARNKNGNEAFFSEWIEVMYALFDQFREPQPQIRIVAHYAAKEPVSGLALHVKKLDHIEDLGKFRTHLKQDIFGPEVNRLFRLAQMLSGRLFAITNELMQKIDPANFGAKQRRYKNGFVYGPPVPITYLKGIDKIGFSDGNKEPVWLWEVTKESQEKK